MANNRCMTREIEFTPLYYDYVLGATHPVVVQVGGRFSGKTQNDGYRLSSNLATKKEYKLLVIEDLETGMADGFHAGLRQRIEEMGQTQAYNPSSRTAYIKNTINGNEVLFKGYATEQQRLNVKKLTGITEIVVEEGEWMDYDSFVGLLQQLRGGKEEDRKLTILMNPTNPECFVNKHLIMPPPDRVLKYFPDGVRPKVFIKNINTSFEYNGEVVKQTIPVLVVISTHHDNPFLTMDQRASIEQLKDTDPDKYLQLGEARFVGLSGSYFNKANMRNRMANCFPPMKVGEFVYEYRNEKIVDESIRFEECEGGCIRMYEEPIKGHPYVLSGDTAGDGSDYNVGYMTDNTTEADIAVLHTLMDEDQYARQMYCFGKWYGKLNDCYNNALMGIEINFSTHPQKEVQRLGYDNFYNPEASPADYTNRLAKKFGWNTNKATRPMMLSKFRAFFRDEPWKILDHALLQEMTVFVKDDKGKPAAAPGYHDDLVMARAINCSIAWQQEEHVRVDRRAYQLPRALQSNDDIDDGTDFVDF